MTLPSPSLFQPHSTGHSSEHGVVSEYVSYSLNSEYLKPFVTQQSHSSPTHLAISQDMGRRAVSMYVRKSFSTKYQLQVLEHRHRVPKVVLHPVL